MKYRVVLLVSSGFLLSYAWAQEYRTTLTGQVLDAQGGAMGDVNLTAKLASTGAEFNTISGPTGEYTLPFLPPGSYTVSAVASGFKRYLNANVVLNADTHVTLNITMELGQTTESVTVSADASILGNTTASVDVAIPGLHLESMPSIGGAPMGLAKLAYGVLDMTNPQANSRPFDNSGTSNYQMGSGSSAIPNGSGELLLDGAPNMWGPQTREVAYNPPLDAVEEVKVDMFLPDAGYGDTLGGTIDIITKGGTNQFHGALGEFNSPGALTAVPFFSNAGGVRKLATEYNHYKAMLSGPLYIPKAVTLKNKVFWLLAYEGIKDSAQQPIVTTVPTVAMRQGNFAPLLPLGSSYTIYDPATGVAQTGRVARQPFPGNVIPSNRFNPVALNILSYYPLPNLASTVSGQDDYLANTIERDNYFTVMPRVDFVLSEKHKIFWDYHGVYRTQYIQNLFNNIATGDARPRDGNGSMVDDVYVFSPTMFLNTRVSWSRLVDYEYRDSTVANFNPTSLGFPAYIAANSPKLSMPYLSFSDGTQALSYAVGGVQGAGFYIPFDNYQFFSTMNKVIGTHTIKFGADLRKSQQSTIVWGNSAGSYVFGAGWVNGPYSNSGAGSQGHDVAELLLGLPTSGSYDLNSHSTAQNYYSAFFIQDDWHARSNLTINIGLRYEHETPIEESYDRALDGFNFSAPNAVTAAAKAAYALSPIPQLTVSQFNPAGGATYATNNNPDIDQTYGLAFSPRFGVAYTPFGANSKTVIRGGFGIFFSTYGVTGAQVNGHPQIPMGAYSQSTPFVPSLDGYLTPSSTLSNPFPTGLRQPSGAAAGLNTNLGQTVTYINPNLAQPYSERWSITIQRELAPSLLLELGYNGNRSLHIPVVLNLDGIPAQFLSTSPVRNTAVINAVTANVANPFQNLLPGTNLNGSTVSAGQLLEPFPEFEGTTGVSEVDANAGTSNFHALEVRLQKRLSSGLEFITSYQHSRLLSAVLQQNDSTTALNRMIDSSDRPNRFVSSFVYQLPVGRGKKFAQQASALLNGVIGGWQLSGVVTLQDAAPLSWGNVIYFGGNFDYNAHNPNGAFNTAVFNTNASQALADNIRTFPRYFDNLRQDAIKNVEAAITKTFSIRDRAKVLFRGDAFNVANRVQFGAPNVTPTSTSFSRSTTQVNSPRTIQFSLRLMF